MGKRRAGGGAKGDSRAAALEPAIDGKVLVLNSDPFVPTADGGKQRLHEAGRWNDPRKLADGYAADLERASHGAVKLRVAAWEDLDSFPLKPVNRETWGGPDYQRNYLVWWYTRLPHAAGVDTKSGLENNWWKYVFQYDRYGENGRPRR